MNYRQVILRVSGLLLAMIAMYLGSFPPVRGYLADRYNHASDDAVRAKWDAKLAVSDRVYAPILWVCGQWPALDRAMFECVDFFQMAFNED